MKKLFLPLFALSFTCAFAAGPKNVILLIGDGMALPQRMTAEEFSRRTGSGPLAMNALPRHATTRTCSANSVVTDSAAAATAIACGIKTYNTAIGVDTATNRVTSVAEEARAHGKKVGILTTVTINHATPSGFFGHRKTRNDGYGLGLDLIASGFDYFAGGGIMKHDDRSHPEYRGDIHDLAVSNGYRLINRDYAAFRGLKPGCGKVIFLADEDVMPFDIDSASSDVPSLAEMTAKGIELLSDSPNGFFMMVEGGRIDYAAHAHDPAACVRDSLAFDKAVRVALDFQASRPDTLVIVTGDHETGGMAMGLTHGYGFNVTILTGQKCSVDAVSAYANDNNITDFAVLRPFLQKNFDFAFTEKDWKDMETAFKADVEAARRGIKENEAYNAIKLRKFPSVLKDAISRLCSIGWSSGNHTALPVLTTAKGPGEDNFTGFIENSDIAAIIRKLIF